MGDLSEAAQRRSPRAANPAPEVVRRYGVNEKGANLLVHLAHQRAGVLRFAADFPVPFDNSPFADNQAEHHV